MSAQIKAATRASYRNGFYAAVGITPKSKGTWTVTAERESYNHPRQGRSWTGIVTPSELGAAVSEATAWTLEIGI